jgi:hypothetical protein
MTTSEFETLRQDIKAIRTDTDKRFMDIEQQLSKLEVVLDTKPSVFALYQAVVVMMFGLSATIASTVVILKSMGLLGVVHG